MFPYLATPLQQSLSTLTLTLPRTALCPHSEFYSNLSALVSELQQLRAFTLYAPAGVRSDAVGAPEEGGGDDVGMNELQQSMGNLELRGPDDEEVAHQHASQGHEASHDSTSLPTSRSTFIPKLPLSFLRSLLTDKSTGLPHRRLTLLRVYGIVTSSEALRLIGQDASRDPSGSVGTDPFGGLSDLVLQLETGPLLTVIEHLLPLSASLETLHIMSRIGSELLLYEEDLAWIARTMVNAPKSAADDAPYRLGRLKQIGFRNRVFEVNRELVGKSPKDTAQSDTPDEAAEGGTKTISSAQRHDEVRVTLRRWDASEGRWPEALLVVKA